MEYFDKAKAELGVDELYTVFSTTSNNDARVKLSELFVNMFQDVGVNYENKLEDSQLFFGETLDNGLWDLGEWAWLGSPGTPGSLQNYDLFDPQAPPPDGQNYYRWGTPDSSVIDENTTAVRRYPRRAERFCRHRRPHPADAGRRGRSLPTRS